MVALFKDVVSDWQFHLKFLHSQRDPKTGELEGLSFDFNLCEAVATWEQVSVLVSVAFC